MALEVQRPLYQLNTFTNGGLGYDPLSDFTIDLPFVDYRRIDQFYINIVTSGSIASGDGTLRFRCYLKDDRYCFLRHELMGPHDYSIKTNDLDWAEITGHVVSSASGFHALSFPLSDAAPYRYGFGYHFKELSIVWSSDTAAGGDASFDEINVGLSFGEK